MPAFPLASPAPMAARSRAPSDPGDASSAPPGDAYAPSNRRTSPPRPAPGPSSNAPIRRPSSAMPPPPAQIPPPASSSRSSGASYGNARQESGPYAGAYLQSLGQLARALTEETQRGLDPASVRRLRERLRHWVEDVRSVGLEDLAVAVADQVQRLGAALSGADVANEIAAIAGVLAAIAAGGPLPPKKSGRPAFWK